MENEVMGKLLIVVNTALVYSPSGKSPPEVGARDLSFVWHVRSFERVRYNSEFLQKTTNPMLS